MSTVKHRLLPAILAVLAALVAVSVAAATEEAHAVTFPAAVDSGNFPDPVWRDWVKTNVTGGNDVLTEGEAKAVTEVDVSSMGIADLTGIEYLEDLSMLRCNDNDLTSLDLSGNPALTTLYCYSNDLTDLNVTNNASLAVLFCSSNDLANLDVSANSNLTNLSCGYNGFISLNLSNNPALTHINCDDNKLTVLDLSSNPKLSVLFCRKNDLTDLNVSGNPKLMSLDCSNNDLTFLDVSSNPALSSFWCRNNDLIALDVSNNPKLTAFSRSGNGLLFINGMLASAIGEEDQWENQAVTVHVLATGSGGYESTDFVLPPDAAHSLSLASSGVSYDTSTGLFTTDTLDPVDFQTFLGGSVYLSGAIYFEEVVTFDVTFIDWDDTVLSEQTVFPGANAVAPPNPVRSGYVFAGWNKGFTDVQEDLIVQATYTPVPVEGNGTAEGNGTPVPGTPVGDPKPVPPAGKLATTGDSSTSFAALAAALSLTACIALAATAGLARRRG